MSQKADLFNSIAQSYDRFNHVLSLGIDRTWRRRSVRRLHHLSDAKILDIACGTCDLSIEMARQGAKSIIGCDISDGMLDIGSQKIKDLGYEHVISLTNADCRHLPFDDNSFDIITCAYGVRNFEHRKECLTEILRVLKPAGQLMIIDFAMPRVFPIKQLYNFYFKHILPHVGKQMTGEEAPFRYFYNSVRQFPQREAFMNELQSIGFHPTEYKVMTFGISITYQAVKSER